MVQKHGNLASDALGASRNASRILFSRYCFRADASGFGLKQGHECGFPDEAGLDIAQEVGAGGFKLLDH